jgi:adenosylmethionine-8-amino-7-oxononanoate aminotransferase
MTATARADGATPDRSSVLASDRHLIHPLHNQADAADPFVWEKGSGAVLTTVDGRDYIDALACLWNVNVGHGRAELADAAARQMQQLAFASSYAGQTNRPASTLAEKLASIVYPAINHFFLASGGGESNDSAIKTARYFWIAQGQPQKTKIISRDHAYHGVTMGAMSATGIPAFWPMFGGKLPGFVHIQSPYPYRFESTEPGVTPGVAAANLLERAIVSEGADTVAAFIAEPVQGAGGVIVPPDDYFPRIREICDKHDVLLISDEIITGFGRTGRWFGLERYGLQPDIMSFAKGITSGYLPLGGIGVSDRIHDVMMRAPADKRWMHALTYSGHPAACAVALANIDILEREHLVEAAAARGEYLMRRLRELESLDHVGDVRGLGLMAAVELVEDKKTTQAFAPAEKAGERVLRECFRRGVVSRVRGDIFCIAPPFVVTEQQLDTIVNVLGDAIRELDR